MITKYPPTRYFSCAGHYFYIMERILYLHYVDVFNQEIFPAEIQMGNGKIISITRTQATCSGYMLPGFIDAHIHIESSMLVPSEFARIAVQHGTVATVSDPHEIANVCGKEGIEFMLHNAAQVPFNFFFGAPSCVPATSFETAGDILDAEAVLELLHRPDIWYLSEMMNYPGVLNGDEEVMRKIKYAQEVHKPVDGHAPGLTGEKAVAYIQAGIHTDHECVSYEEAEFKLLQGMKILIREGSAAKNFDALFPLLEKYPKQVMFCCDDKHPDELVLHHINHHVLRALQKGAKLFDVLQAACINPVLHYNLPVGLLREGDPADAIVVDSLEEMKVLQTYIRGELVYDQGVVHMPAVQVTPINRFSANFTTAQDFQVATSADTIRVIEALDGQLITRTAELPPKKENGFIVSDIDRDVLKISVVNRYFAAPPAIGFIQHVGLRSGAIASTVAHDSHNIIVVGVEEEAISKAVNALMESGGGICVVKGNEVHRMPLPVGGLMSLHSGEEVAQEYARLDKLAKQLGSSLSAPFMTLSFMALLVIPQLKMSDQGLFDGASFRFVPLEV